MCYAWFTASWIVYSSVYKVLVWIFRKSHTLPRVSQKEQLNSVSMHRVSLSYNLLWLDLSWYSLDVRFQNVRKWSHKMSFEQFCFQHKFRYKDLLWVFAPWKRIVLRKRKTTPAYRFIVLHCLTFSDLQQHSNVNVCPPASQVLQLVCNRLI